MSLGAQPGALVPARPPQTYQMVAFDGDARSKQIVQAVRSLWGALQLGCNITVYISLKWQGPPRTSSLQAPIMQLIGHDVSALITVQLKFPFNVYYCDIHVYMYLIIVTLTMHVCGCWYKMTILFLIISILTFFWLSVKIFLVSKLCYVCIEVNSVWYAPNSLF